MHYTLSFPAGPVEYYLNSGYSQLLQLAPLAHSIIITDRNVHRIYGHLFSDYKVLIVEEGERAKTWETIQQLADKLAAFEAHKTTTLIGIGGGVVTDITGFLASIYMRGIPFAFVPTTLLGMVDAAIGGKNGINVGNYKNMLGAIRQPRFILFDTTFLETLPEPEWANAFAEIIKYACIGSNTMFEQLAGSTLTAYKTRPEKSTALIAQCVQQKNEIVMADEQEQHQRKVLNFGHTAGHAFETLYHLKHGQAVGLGMIVALIASEQALNLDTDVRKRFSVLLQQYSLPVSLRFDVEKVLNTLRRDKKRGRETIDFILLESIGSPRIHPLTFEEIGKALQCFADEYSA